MTVTRRPKVSVIIPTHNRASMLIRAVNSVLTQTFIDLELLIVDDGSTDETPRIVEGLVDPRIRIFHHSRNRGQSAARNTGIVNARGEYIAFLDDDDEFMPNKIARQVEALDAAGPDVGMVYVWSTRVGLTGEIIGTRCGEYEGDVYDVALMLRLTLGVGSTSMITASVFSVVGCFDEQLQVSEDLDFLCRLTKRFEIRVVQQHLAKLHTGHPHLSEASQEHLTARRDYVLKHMAKYRDELAAKRRVRSALWRRVAVLELRIGNYMGALSAVSAALVADPMTALLAIKFLVRTAFGKSLSQ